jgi:hypothetical protein
MRELDLAIAFSRAGDFNEARVWFTKAMQEPLEEWNAEHANPRMELEVLRHEAERLIVGFQRRARRGAGCA